MLQVTDQITIEETDLHERFVRAPGPGGQNVNKVSTAVQLRFDASGCQALPEPVRKRLLQLAGRRLGSDGFVTIDAHRFRARERNREDARLRLADLIRKAARQPKPRKKTRPSRAAKERRLACKHRRSMTKRLRGTVSRED
jgi:ribosome-associated protein